MVHGVNALRVCVVCVVALLWTAVRAAGQTCPSQWLPGNGMYGTNGAVNAMVAWDPDGAGPQGHVLVLGGTFTMAGDKIVNRIATYDPSTGVWGALGSIGHTINALAIDATGSLLSGTNSGVYRWNGTSHVALGSSSTVRALLVMPNGDIVAGGGGFIGSFFGVARWNGAAWTGVLPSNVSNGQVNALALMPNGDIAMGGTFTQLGGTTVSYLARWNGAAVSSIGTAPNSPVYALLTAGNGDLIAGGGFTTIGGTSVGTSRVGRWNGTAWSVMPMVAAVSQVNSLALAPNGDIYVGSQSSNVVQRVTASGGSQVGVALPGAVLSFAFMPSGDLFAGTTFVAGSPSIQGVARWSGTAWAPIPAAGVSGIIYALVATASGDVIAGGNFAYANGQPAGNIAQRVGAVWSPIGAGFDGVVRAVCVTPGGDIIAGGDFQNSGATPVSRIARWNGSAWTPMGTGMNASVRALLVLDNGDVVAGGSFTTAGGASATAVARWNGTSWSAHGANMTGGTVHALLESSDGSLYAGGSFSVAGDSLPREVARLRGAQWSALESDLYGVVYALAENPRGDIFAGGAISYIGSGASVTMTAVSNIVRFRGGLASPLESGADSTVQALATLPNGDIVAGGAFMGAGSANSSGPDYVSRAVVRFDDPTWKNVDRGLHLNFSSFNPVAYALLVLPSGRLAVAGDFLVCGAPTLTASAYFAEWTSSLPGIVDFPQDATVCVGLPASFTCSATAGVTFQWKLDGVPIPAADNPTATTATLLIPSAQAWDTGEYTCTALNACGDVTSTSATLTVLSDCAAGVCDDIDFNNDGLSPDTLDIDSFLSVFSGGPCL